MPSILQINVTANWGSTGKIAEQIGQTAMRHGWESYIKRYNPKTMYMSGSFLVFDKEMFLKAGCFDENIFMYYEEPDITNRILSIGGNVCWAKDIFVKHLAHGRQFNKKTWEIMRESYFYYAKKYGVDIDRGRINAINILRFKFLVAKLLGQKEKAFLFKKQVESLQIELNC